MPSKPIANCTLSSIITAEVLIGILFTSTLRLLRRLWIHIRPLFLCVEPLCYLFTVWFQLCHCEGELFFHLKKKRRFSEAEAQIIVAEVGMALGHLHSLDVIYRDLKPENILLDHEGHICLTDFGLSKDLARTDEDMTHSFCGVFLLLIFGFSIYFLFEISERILH